MNAIPRANRDPALGHVTPKQRHGKGKEMRRKNNCVGYRGYLKARQSYEDWQIKLSRH